MKAENIERKENYVICYINSVRLEGTLEQVNKLLIINGREPLKFEPEHWSETKQSWIPIKDMAATHIENYLTKRKILNEYEIGNLRDNDNNFRDYMRRLISVYDNYKK